MDKEKIDIANRFNDLSDCTEYYYDELGKLNAVRPGSGDLTKKEGKRIRKRIMSFLNSALDNLEMKSKAIDAVDKAEVEDFNKEFKAEKPQSFLSRACKAIANFPKKVVCALTRGKKCADIEISAPEEQELLLAPDCGTEQSEEEKQDTDSSLSAIEETIAPEVLMDDEEEGDEEEN